MDLEHSFGPVYAGGLLCKGRSSLCLVRSKSVRDASFHRCCPDLRNLVVEGLKSLLGAASSARNCERIAHLNPNPAKWRLFEFEERKMSHWGRSKERALDGKNVPDFVNLIRRVGEVRRPESARDHPLFRLHPARWLEWRVIQESPPQMSIPRSPPSLTPLAP